MDVVYPPHGHCSLKSVVNLDNYDAPGNLEKLLMILLIFIIIVGIMNHWSNNEHNIITN
jgi:hypothetical protein